MSFSDVAMEATMAANPSNKQGMKIRAPTESEIECVLRDIEEKNLDRRTFNLAIQIFKKSESSENNIYGSKGSEARRALSQWIPNNVKRGSWQCYVNRLDARNIPISETTSAGLQKEIQDKAEKDREEPSNRTIFRKTATLNLPAASTSLDVLTNQFAGAAITPRTAKIGIRTPTFGTPNTPTFGAPQLSNQLSFDSSFGSYRLGPTEFPLPDYIQDGTAERPHVICFNHEKMFNHGNALIHLLTIKRDGRKHPSVAVQISGPAPDANNVALEMATRDNTPSFCHDFVDQRLVLLLKEPLMNGISLAYETWAKEASKTTVPTKTGSMPVVSHPAEVESTKEAITAGLLKEPDNALYSIIMFPKELGALDNRILSNTSDYKFIKCEKVRLTITKGVGEKKSEIAGFTATWKIALATAGEMYENRDDNDVDMDNFW